MSMTICHLDLVELRQKLNEYDDITAGTEIKFFSTCYDYEEGIRKIYFAAFQDRKLVGVALLKTGVSASPLPQDGMDFSTMSLFERTILDQVSVGPCCATCFHIVQIKI